MIRAIAVLLLLLVPPMSVRADSLSDYRWKNRLVLWQSDSAEFREKFQKTWDAVAAECAERDVLVLPIEGAALRDELDVAAGENVILLVGKDGGVKERWSEAVDPAAVFALIDAMPMRKREMRE